MPKITQLDFVRSGHRQNRYRCGMCRDSHRASAVPTPCLVCYHCQYCVHSPVILDHASLGCPCCRVHPAHYSHDCGTSRARHHYWRCCSRSSHHRRLPRHSTRQADFSSSSTMSQTRPEIPIHKSKYRDDSGSTNQAATHHRKRFKQINHCSVQIIVAMVQCTADVVLGTLSGLHQVGDLFAHLRVI